MQMVLGPLAGLIAGLVIGSFIAVLTLRWPSGRSVVSPRSQCDNCGQTLAAADLVPVLSVIVLRGRCRTCGGPIALRHTWIELGGGAIGAIAMGLHPGLVGLAGAVLGWWLLALAMLDAEHLWLPDALTLPLAGLGLAAVLVVGPPMSERVIGAVAGYLSLILVALAYRAARGRTGLGGGDPKLFAAIGAWLGWTQLPLVMFAAAMLGLGLIGIDRLRGRRIDRQAKVPLGALLAAAAWPVWLLTAVPVPMP